MGKQKSFKELYKELDSVRQKIKDEQKRETDLQNSLGPALDAEIIKIIREKYRTDSELFQLISDIQSGAIEIKFQPKNNSLIGDDTHEQNF